jgi:integrase/recombinase XerD
MLDDRGYLALLRLYLARSGYTSGPLFRASINGRGGALSYDAAHNRWKKYCAAAGIGTDINQLRHAHATEFRLCVPKTCATRRYSWITAPVRSRR